MNPRILKIAMTTLAFAVGAWLIAYEGIWKWGFCRVEVPAGKSLLLRYKGPFPFALGKIDQAPEGTLVSLDTKGRPTKIGILSAMPGPGRHFFSPLEYERQLVDDIVVEPGSLGVVTSKGGRPLPPGQILADAEGFRGTWRRVLTPGRYRLNSYAYKVDVVAVSACVGSSPNVQRRDGDPTLIPPGYVGVVTNKVDDPATSTKQGIQENILQPGIYFINPFAQQVDIVSVGFNETTLTVEAAAPGATDQRRGRLEAQQPGVAGAVEPSRDPVYVQGKGIEYPSSDGFLIHMDYTAIWGILPDQAPDVVRQFGTLKDVENKVIEPQIGSICRLYGSKRGAVDLLVGDKREEFQTDTAEELERVLQGKNLTLLFGLTRHIYVPSQVREPIQKKFIADELKLTADQKQLTAQAQAALTEAIAKVVLEEKRTGAETIRKVAEKKAEGEKSAKEIAAETERIAAEIEAETAVIQAKITTTMGEAAARKVELTNQAEADRYRQYVEALGGPDAYNKYVFADKLPEDMKLGVFYAGPGTFWTDMKGMEQTLMSKMVSEAEAAKATRSAADPDARPVLPTITAPGR
jgi:regulator of protease activity HflC (stomatin/prohibitin superfamily)